MDPDPCGWILGDVGARGGGLAGVTVAGGPVRGAWSLSEVGKTGRCMRGTWEWMGLPRNLPELQPDGGLTLRPRETRERVPSRSVRSAE